MNADQMRTILADEILQVRAGKRSARDANAVTNAAAKILASVRLELEYARMLGVVPKLRFVNLAPNRVQKKLP